MPTMAKVFMGNDQADQAGPPKESAESGRDAANGGDDTE
jgi:hypothetical protein